MVDGRVKALVKTIRYTDPRLPGAYSAVPPHPVPVRWKRDQFLLKRV